MSLQSSAAIATSRLGWMGLGLILAISIDSPFAIPTRTQPISSKLKNESLASGSIFAYPITGIRKSSSPYGARLDPFTHGYGFHKGVDFSAPAGTPVHASQDGKVINVNYDQSNGQYVEIEHANGFKTKYAHLANTWTQKGTLIKQGQEIGKVGSSGRSTSPHLHFELSQQNLPINPLTILNQASPAQLANTSDANNAGDKKEIYKLQKVAFITNSGVTYRMVEVAKIK